MTIDAFGVERKVMVQFLVPWNVTKLFTALVCHAFLGKTAITSMKKGSGMLGATIYDKVIKFCFSHTIKNGEVRQISQKNTTYHNKMKW